MVSTLSNYAGRASAATLGYIAGSIPGAIGADYLYQKMANASTLKRQRSASRGRSKKRRVVKPQYRSVSRKLSKSKRVSFNVADPHHVVSARRGRPLSVGKRLVKPAKLRKDVKMAIKKIVRGQEIRGTYIKTLGNYQWYGGSTTATGASGLSFDNKQKVEYLRVADAFGPSAILDAASILWNNKAPAATGQADVSTGVFDALNTKVYARNVYQKITFKSNSKRTYHYKMYICSPKKSDAYLEPRGDWDTGMYAQREAGVANDSGPNVLSINLETLHASPALVQQFNKNWSYEVVKFKLEPGETYNHYVQGPKEQMIDFAKYYEGSTYLGVQKFSKFIFCVYYGDMISTTTGAVGHYEDIGDISADAFDGKGILITQKIVMDLTMPEQAGFKYNAATTQNSVQNSTQRRYAYAHTVFMDAKSGTPVRVDEEDPNNATDPT